MGEVSLRRNDSVRIQSHRSSLFGLPECQAFYPGKNIFTRSQIGDFPEKNLTERLQIG
jgi:hypothetical protein